MPLAKSYWPNKGILLGVKKGYSAEIQHSGHLLHLVACFEIKYFSDFKRLLNARAIELMLKMHKFVINSLNYGSQKKSRSRP
jgi:hypothetical protein